MPSEAPSRATAASWAAEPVWVAVDFDRACGVRRRGARWRLRAGVFASPGSTFAGLFACLRGCLLAIVFVLWIRIALRDAYTATSPALGARRAATQKGLSTWTAMLAAPGKSSGKWVTSVKVVEKDVSEEVAKGQAAMGGSFAG